MSSFFVEYQAYFSFSIGLLHGRTLKNLPTKLFECHLDSFCSVSSSIVMEKAHQALTIGLFWLNNLVVSSVVEVVITVFEPGKPISKSSLSYSVLSMYGTNILGNFTSLN